jgi:hypothetical protein
VGYEADAYSNPTDMDWEFSQVYEHLTRDSCAGPMRKSVISNVQRNHILWEHKMTWHHSGFR